MNMNNIQSNLGSSDSSGQKWHEFIRRHVESLRFGTVEVTLQDSRVIQIEKTKRVRFTNGGTGFPSGSATVEADIHLGRLK
jgi:hypothetical protein